MNYITLKARAKINIALDIIGKRPDGYHDMRMIMQSIALHDNIFIKKIFTDTIVLDCDHKWVPSDSRNLAFRAAEFLIAEFGIRHGVYIHIKKNIPVSAGLAGGSSDCAATLYGMRQLFKLPINDAQLLAIGRKFGADVPFCIARGTMLAEGIGDVMTGLSPHPPVYILLAKPWSGLSTATVFAKYSHESVRERPNIDLIIKLINNGDAAGIAANLCNVLEPTAIGLCPIIADIKRIMSDNNALGQAMTGSGPTVFGLYSRREDCYKTMHEIREKLPQVRELLLTRVFNI